MQYLETRSEWVGERIVWAGTRILKILYVAWPTAITTTLTLIAIGDLNWQQYTYWPLLGAAGLQALFLVLVGFGGLLRGSEDVAKRLEIMDAGYEAYARGEVGCPYTKGLYCKLWMDGYREKGAFIEGRQQAHKWLDKLRADTDTRCPIEIAKENNPWDQALRGLPASQYDAFNLGFSSELTCLRGPSTYDITDQEDIAYIAQLDQTMFTSRLVLPSGLDVLPAPLGCTWKVSGRRIYQIPDQENIG